MTHILLPDNVKKCIDTLSANGYEAYAVGGCVRDCLLGITPKDYDVTTSALPEQVMKCFDITIPTGIKFGTVTVIVDGMTIEITTFRSECQYDDYRRPSRIDFAADITSDLSRRDFTINAMAYSPEKGLIDLYGGREHLEKGIICAVGTAQERFGEDALRIMRAFRFALRLGFSIEEDTQKAALMMSHNLCKISSERIAAELTACLATANPSGIKPLLDENALGFVGIGKTKAGFDRLDFVANDRYARLCALILLCECQNEVEICKQLKMDGKTIKSVALLIEYSRENIAYNRREVCRLLDALGAELFDSLMSIKSVVFGVDIAPYMAIKNDILQNNIPYKISHLDIDGNELHKSAGVPKGKMTGTVLKMLLDTVIENPESNNKSELILAAKAIMQAVNDNEHPSDK